MREHNDTQDVVELVKQVFRHPPNRVATLGQLRIEHALKSIIADMSMIFAKQRPVNEATTVLSSLRNIDTFSNTQLLNLQDEITQVSKREQSYSRELESIADALAMLNSNLSDIATGDGKPGFITQSIEQLKSESPEEDKKILLKNANFKINLKKP